MSSFLRSRAIVGLAAALSGTACSDIAQPNARFLSIEPLQAAYHPGEPVTVRLRNLGPTDLLISSCEVKLQEYAGRWKDVSGHVVPGEEILCPSTVDIVLLVGAFVDRQAGPYPLPSVPSGGLYRFRFDGVYEKESQELLPAASRFSQPFLVQ